MIILYLSSYVQPWPIIFTHCYSIKLFHMTLFNYHSGCIKLQYMLLLCYKHTQTHKSNAIRLLYDLFPVHTFLVRMIFFL